jgi:hypothetical protein
MPQERMLDNRAFDPDAIRILARAYEDACAALRLDDRTDPLTQIVAKKIIEHATRGERDPIRLREMALKDLRAR